MSAKNLAKIVSFLFHPLFMPTYGLLIIYNSGTILDFTQPSIKWKIYFTVFVMTFLLPAIINAALNNFKIIKNYELSENRDRVIPLFITLASYFTLFYMTRNLGIPFMVKKFIFASTITVAFIFVISVFWKISAHMAGVGGVLSLILAFMVNFGTNHLFLFSIIIFLSGIIGSSRLQLNAHNPAQIYLGYIAGCSIVFSIFIYV